MRYTVTVRARARRNEVRRKAGSELMVRTTAAPEKGKANRAVCALIAHDFGIAKNRVHIVCGKGSPKKIIAVEE